MHKSTKKTLYVAVGYVLFMLFVFFLGMPKVSLGAGLVAGVGVTAFYALVVFAITKLLKKKRCRE